MKSEKNSCLLEFYSSMILPCPTPLRQQLTAFLLPITTITPPKK